MVHYIPKAAVVAELERRKRKLLDHIICERDKEWVVRTVHQLNRIIMFIDTLEVTDVDAIRRNWYNQGYLKGRREANIPARELGLPNELNTLEVKEVDLSLIEPHIKEEWNKINTGHTYSIIDSYNIFVGICTYFYELGIKAQKGE